MKNLKEKIINESGNLENKAWDAVFDYIDSKISGGYNIQYCTWKDMYDKYNGSLLDKTLNPLDYDA